MANGYASNIPREKRGARAGAAARERVHDLQAPRGGRRLDVRQVWAGPRV